MFSFQVLFHLRIQSSRTFSNFELQKGKPKHLHRKIHNQTTGLCKKVVLSKISPCSKILVERNYKVRKTSGNLLEHSSQFRFQYVPKKFEFIETVLKLLLCETFLIYLQEICHSDESLAFNVFIWIALPKVSRHFGQDCLDRHQFFSCL